MNDLSKRLLAVLGTGPATMVELMVEVRAARTVIQRELNDLQMRGRIFTTKLPGSGREIRYHWKPKPTPSFAGFGITREELSAEREAWKKRCPIQEQSGKCPRVRGEPISGAWAGPFRLHGIFTESEAA